MEWREIPEFDDYLISENGDVKSYKKLKPCIMKSHPWEGYFKIKLLRNDGCEVTISIHRLVANSFLKNPNNLAEIDHLDGTRDNNHYTNLEWVSKLENLHRMHKDRGVYPFGENAYNAKLSDIDIPIIKEAIKIFGRGAGSKIARYYKVDKALISRIRLGKSWSHV